MLRAFSERMKDCSQKHLFKTKICKLAVSGSCHYGARCFYAHSEADLQLKPNLQKTSLCRGAKDGSCSLGSSCSFAHSSKELRESSKRIPCKWMLEGHCSHGRSCRFSHSYNQSSSSSSTASSEPADSSESLLEFLRTIEGASSSSNFWELLLRN